MEQKNPYGMTRNYPASDFYRIGQTVTVNAPSFRDNGKVYVSKDKSQTLTLKEKNIRLTFTIIFLKHRSECRFWKEIRKRLDFVLPGAEVQVTAGDYTGKTVADEAGYFLSGTSGNKRGRYALLHEPMDREAGSTAAEKAGNGRFVVKIMFFFGMSARMRM